MLERRGYHNVNKECGTKCNPHFLFAITSCTAVRISEMVCCGSAEPNMAVPATNTFEPKQF